jgi:HEAT repeat protein
MTLASLAPVSLEATLLEFAGNPEFSRYAPLAFHRLNTPQSLQAMADLSKTAGPGTWEQMEAARYLAETGDQKWFPLLLDAVKNWKISGYPAYAAELGGARMLPVLVDLTRNPDTGLQAIMALGSTDTREAVPILLEFLKSPDPDIFYRAEDSLRQLTHRTSAQDTESRGPQTEYQNWSKWWRREGATAPIYRDTECEEEIPLPLAPN